MSNLLTRVGWYAALFVAPLWIAQGLWVRLRIPRLPAAAGPQSGEVGRGATSLRIAVIGESPVAGVGASTQAEGLAAQTAAALARGLDARVHWHAFGKNGATARSTLETLVPDFCNALQRAPVDLLVVALGVNDTTHLTSMRSFPRHWQQLLAALRQQTTAPILVTAVPPMGLFPALPQPLRSVFGLRSAMLDARLRSLLNSHSNVHHVPMHNEMHDEMHDEMQSEMALDLTRAKNMAADGFHPSPLGYRQWGAHIAGCAAPLLSSSACVLKESARKASAFCAVVDQSPSIKRGTT